MEQSVKCPNCGSENSVAQKFCGTCGAKLVTEAQQQKIKCPNCGSQNPTTQQFCGACGTKLTATTQETPGKAAEAVVHPQQIEVKPTWGLAWGLYWRMLLLGLLIAGIVYLIAMVVMLAFGYTLPAQL